MKDCKKLVIDNNGELIYVEEDEKKFAILYERYMEKKKND